MRLKLSSLVTTPLFGISLPDGFVCGVCRSIALTICIFPTSEYHTIYLIFLLSYSNMSEGGVYPWKRRDNNQASAPDYQRLLRPLPEPPAGLTWIHDDAAPQKWILVAHTNVPAVQHEGYYDTSDINEQRTTTTAAATATRIVPLETETEALLSRGNATNEPSSSTVFAEATVAAGPCDESSLIEASHGTTVDYNHHFKEEGVAMLPQASIVADEPQIIAADIQTTSASLTKKSSKENEDVLLEEYTEHVVLPTDTLAGLCLLYKISRRELQRVNKFSASGDDLRLAPKKLYIPITEKARRLGWKPQDVNSPEFKMAAFMAQFPNLSMMEAKWYVYVCL